MLRTGHGSDIPNYTVLEDQHSFMWRDRAFDGIDNGILALWSRLLLTFATSYMEPLRSAEAYPTSIGYGSSRRFRDHRGSLHSASVIKEKMWGRIPQ